MKFANDKTTALDSLQNSTIAISQRYVDPSEDAVLPAMSRLGEHNSGHSGKMALPAATESLAVTGA